MENDHLSNLQEAHMHARLYGSMLSVICVDDHTFSCSLSQNDWCRNLPLSKKWLSTVCCLKPSFFSFNRGKIQRKCVLKTWIPPKNWHETVYLRACSGISAGQNGAQSSQSEWNPRWLPVLSDCCCDSVWFRPTYIHVFLLILKASIVHENRRNYDSKHCCSFWH